jgi:integrase
MIERDEGLLAEMTPPDVHALIRQFRGWRNVPAEAWKAYDQAIDYAKWATDAGLPAHCRLHGLKKAGMTRLANDGATTHELMAVSGHKTLAEVERYTQEANDKLLATSAMAKRGRDQTGNSRVPNPEARLGTLPSKPLKS